MVLERFQVISCKIKVISFNWKCGKKRSLSRVTEMTIPILYSDILCFPVKFNFLMGT